MDAKYEFKKLSAGTIEIRIADGSLVPDDVSDQDFLDFLHWNSMQSPIPYPDVCQFAQIYFFSDVPSVVEHFKKNASLIDARLEGMETSERHIHRGTAIAVTTGETRQFYILEKAVPSPTHPDVIVSGWDGMEKSGFSRGNSQAAVTRETLDRLNAELSDEESDVRRVSSWTVSRCFVYIDVSDFSKMPPGHQVLVINSIVRAVEYAPYWEPQAARDAKADLEAQICIGDGYIFVLRDPWKAAFFAAYLANLIEYIAATGNLQVAFHFRMGAHFGKVYSFHDPGRKNWNYIGDGINGGQRVLGAVGKETDDVLYISAELRQAMMKKEKPEHFPNIVLDAHNRGRKEDKHGTPWRVYEINHTSLMDQYNTSIRGDATAKP
jgi:class 3 adenylate cyclase